MKSPSRVFKNQALGKTKVSDRERPHSAPDFIQSEKIKQTVISFETGKEKKLVISTELSTEYLQNESTVYGINNYNKEHRLTQNEWN